jgi:malate dehydrogenase (oxaloacetate-decarboxylating)
VRLGRGVREIEVIVTGVIAPVAERREETVAEAGRPWAGTVRALGRSRGCEGHGGDKREDAREIEDLSRRTRGRRVRIIASLATPSAQFSLTLRVELPSRPGGVLGKVTAAITRAGGSIVAVDTVDAKGDRTLREITVECSSVDHRGHVITAVQSVRAAKIVEITDRTFEVHRSGKIHTGLNIPVKTRDDLSMAYTPGVARVCSAIAENRQKAFKYTIKANTVAVVSDGTAVLGLGDIGPEAAMPVMEGKSMLFKEFAGVDAFPICLSTKDVDEIVETVERISPTFGGINLEDISSPRCFEIEQRLQESLDIPVFHDDQHGTAIVTLAALINSCRLTGRDMKDLEVLMVGAGAAGVAVAKILMDAGVTSIVACDRYGAIHTGREDYEAGSMNMPKRWLAENTNPGRRDGSPREVIEGTDLFVGLSGPGIIDAADLQRMNPEPFVFAMANPNPEVKPEEAASHVRVMATGRSDYPNQINNVLAFPGVFRGALDARATAITEEMKLAAANGIASVVEDEELDEDYIIPSVFNRDVSQAVASAVAEVAERSREPVEEAEQPTVERAAVG